jgi:cell division protein FtsL
MNKKDTIYIDVDDEITAVIHKVINSKSKLVALVLPKRASVFHSSVNLKLLKAKSVKSGKTIVLVSSDANLLALAGVVGISVAKNLQDKPSVPETKKELNKAERDKSEFPANDKADFSNDPNITNETDDLEATDQSKSIGEFAALSAIGGEPELEDNDAIEFDNDAKKTEPKIKDKKQKIDKKLKVPDFGKFQKILIISVVAAIALVVLYVIGFIEMPKAKITIQSSTSTLSSTIPLTLDSTVTTLNSTDTVVPANMQSVQKTVTSSPVNTTGSKQIGIYATGTITVTTPAGETTSTDIPSGTIFTGVESGLTYQSTSDTTISCNPPSGYLCQAGSAKVYVTATAYGTNYNTLSQEYTTDLSNLPGPYSGTAMSGATQPSTVQTVAQADINAANKEIVAPVSATIEQQLEQEITTAGFTPETSTFVAATPVITDSNTVGTQTNTVTATGTYSYSMYGVHPADLDTVVTNAVGLSSSFNASKQSILDTGSAGATFTVESSTATSIKVSMDVSSVIGPKLNVAQIKTESAGQSDAKIINNISTIPGVQSVTIKYSPFWVTAMTHNTKKITVILEKSDGSAT